MFFDVLYRDIHEGLHENVRLINDLAERGVHKGELVANRPGGSVHKEDFTPSVQLGSVVQRRIPAARASVQKRVMSSGTNSMAELRENALKSD